MTGIIPSPVDFVRSHWWVPLLRGIVGIAFGCVLFLLPISAVFTLVILFGAFAFADGIMAIVWALRAAHPERGRWWLMIVQGVAGIAIGAVTFFYPGITGATLGLFIAAWAVVTGIFEIGAAINLRRDVPNEILLIVSGLLSVAVGCFLFLFPFGALLALVYLIAAYGIISGITLIALAFRLRGGSVKAR
jgi:uncharacterized membrane protein HdeD (DUF308 family)